MKKKIKRYWWPAYIACVASVAGVMVWMTLLVLDLEQGEGKARSQAEHQEAVRLALWRMDSWFAPLIAREGSRPYYAYESYHSKPAPSYTKVLREIAPGEVLDPSTLLTFRSDFISLHFKIDRKGQLSSPQIPEGNQRDLAESTLLTNQDIQSRHPHLERVRKLLDVANPQMLLANAEASALDFACDALGAEESSSPEQKDSPPSSTQEMVEGRTQREYESRARNTMRFQQVAPADAGQMLQIDSPTKKNDYGGPRHAPMISQGPLIPLWVADESEINGFALLYMRRVTIDQNQTYQGFLANWTSIRNSLILETEDLLQSPVLRPIVDASLQDDRSGMLLTTIPVALNTATPTPRPPSLLSPARVTLGGAWLMVVVAIIMVGVTLHSSITLGEKRSRFASAVTHELRTPLTTFRMYSEMLADDMITDTTQRKEYLNTLKSESDRLSRLVENVLTYARLEEGRAVNRPQETRVPELLHWLDPPLQNRVGEAGMSLSIENTVSPDLTVKIDREAVSQILFNLVDNACKYAADATNRVIHILVTETTSALLFRTRDHGPGVTSAVAGSIFSPFDRGDRDSADPASGIGLGLALSRGLARDLGGNLTLETNPDSGACFVLELPLRPNGE